jgi:phenylacetic acid degradation operon negative regulatory protein
VPADWRETARRLGVRPLSARSLALSTLLGSHPPRLAGPALVAVGALFELGPGTMRTAVSRMVADGELIAVGGGQFELGAAMLDRQHRLDVGRQGSHADPMGTPWSGEWWTAIVLAERRGLAERRLFRAEMTKRLMGELRPDVWLRPANVSRPVANGDVLVVRGAIDRDPVELAHTLWHLDELSATARTLSVEADAVSVRLAADDRTVLPRSFIVSVAVARFLAVEPQLPSEIVGADWPVDELREQYRDLERRHGRSLRGYIGDTVEPVT